MMQPQPGQVPPYRLSVPPPLPPDPGGPSPWDAAAAARGRHASPGEGLAGYAPPSGHDAGYEAGYDAGYEGDPGEPQELDDDLLRPFVVTRGRSRPQVAGLRVETQLRARPETVGRVLRFEAQRIVTACRTPRSVAEIAVVLGMPLGVARILIADLIADRMLVHEEPGQISIAVLERIRERVRAL